MIFSYVVPFKRKRKKIPDLSLPPYIRWVFQKVFIRGRGCLHILSFFLLAVEREIETKAQTFRYWSLLWEQNQNVLIWSAYYRNKSRTFQSVPKLFKIGLERFGVILKLINKTRTKPSYFRIGSKRFHTPMLQRKRNGTFVNYFQIFFTSSERFCLLQAA